MKTYCKHLKVADAEKIYEAVTEYMHDKYRKNSSVRFYAGFTGMTKQDVRGNIKPGNKLWETVNHRIAEEIAFHIQNRTVKEHLLERAYGSPLIHYTKIKDSGSGKERMLGLETVLFRLYETVAQKAALPMFDAKLGTYQVSSIKGRGQNYGKRAVRHWLATDVDGTKYFTKSDIRQCYPSIQHEKLKGLLHRDLAKCSDLLYLFDTFLELYEEYPNPEAEAKECGILIGSPVSKDLCNYFLSYAYHYASERLVKTVRRRGQTETRRLISHLIFYADDIVMYGGNKKDLHLAMQMLIKYMNDFLGLTIKSDWTKSKAEYIDKSGKARGGLLDYMGFKFRCGVVFMRYYFGRAVKHRRVWTTIRGRIFLNARRKLAEFEKMVRRKQKAGIKFVKGITSQFGWFKNTDSVQYRKINKVDKLMKIARKIISDNAKGREYDTNKYFKMWRRYYA